MDKTDKCVHWDGEECRIRAYCCPSFNRYDCKTNGMTNKKAKYKKPFNLTTKYTDTLIRLGDK